MDLTGTLIKNTYGNVLTLGTVAGTPTSGTLQNGAGQDVTSLTLSSTANIFGTGGYKLAISGGGQSFLPNLDIIVNLGFGPAFSSDTFLTRDGASGTLAQRNSTNAQTFNIYNTYTDGSNYERGFLKWDSNVLKIGTEALGTGTAREINITPSGQHAKFFDGQTGKIAGFYHSTSRQMFIYPQAGFSEIGGSVPIRVTQDVTFNGKFLEFIEQTAPSAPATNEVRIYAEDNGSGKTKLMALFATGAAQQIAIEP